jgi:hypothetical protein
MPPRKPKPKRSLKNKTNPWDIPPVPAKGDDDINITYASIGRALSKWEEFEEQLSYAFAIFCGGADESTEPAQRAYGSVIAFRGRSDIIRSAAEAYFHLNPNEELLKEFNAIMVRAERLAARRNEIAHGIVKGMPLTGEPKFPGWGLRPSEYASNKNVPLWKSEIFYYPPKIHLYFSGN